MITTKRVSLVVLTIASLCSLNANAMWRNPLKSLRTLRQTQLKVTRQRKKCLGAINGFAQRYDKVKRNSTLKDQEENSTLTAIAQECQSKTGYTSLDESYNGFYDRSKTLERLNMGVTAGILGTVVASISAASAASNSSSLFGYVLEGILSLPVIAGAGVLVQGDLLTYSYMSLPVIAGAGVLVHGGLLTYSYINSSEKFGGSPRLRRQFVRQQYPWFSKAEEQSTENK